MSLHVVIVHNPKSGSAPGVVQLRSLCSDHDVVIDDIIAISQRFSRKLKPHVQRGAVIMAIGGDGTVSAVAGVVADTKATLLPLPGGTLNNFTKDLGIPQDLDQALAHALSTPSRRIDIASVNDHSFINNSSIGLYPQSLRTRERLQDRLGKWPAAIVAVARAFVRYRTYTVRVGRDSFQTPFIFVGNNSYHIDQPGLAHRDQLDGGVLSVSIAKTTSRLDLMALLLLSVAGRLHRAKSFAQINCTELTISSPKHSTIRVSHDGELSKLSLPITYRQHKKALRIRG